MKYEKETIHKYVSTIRVEKADVPSMQSMLKELLTNAMNTKKDKIMLSHTDTACLIQMLGWL